MDEETQTQEQAQDAKVEPAAPVDPFQAALAAIQKDDKPSLPDIRTTEDLAKYEAQIKAQKEQLADDTQAQAEPDKTPPSEMSVPDKTEGTDKSAQQITPTEYYAKLAELDRQNRLLKKELKDREEMKGPDLSSLAKEKPLEALDKLGIGLDQILEAYAGASGVASQPSDESSSSIPIAVQEKLAKLEKLERTIEELQKSRQQETQEQIIQREISRIGDIVSSASNADPSKYEYISATQNEGSLGLVLQTARAIYEREGEVPSYSEVLDMVENHLREQEIARLQRLKNLTFFKSHLTGATAPVQSKSNGESKTAKSSEPSKTLSSAEDTPAPRELTDDERFKLALRKLEGDL